MGSKPSTTTTTTRSPFHIDIQKHWKGFNTHVDFVNTTFHPGRNGLKPISSKTSHLSAAYIITDSKAYATYTYWVQHRASEPRSWISNPFKPKPFSLAEYSTAPSTPLPTPLEYHEFTILQKPEYEVLKSCKHERHPGDEVTSSRGCRYCPVCLMAMYVEFMLVVDRVWKATPTNGDERTMHRYTKLQIIWGYAKSRLVNAVEMARERAGEEKEVLARKVERKMQAGKVGAAEGMLEKAEGCEYSFERAVGVGVRGLEKVNSSLFLAGRREWQGGVNVMVSPLPPLHSPSPSSPLPTPSKPTKKTKKTVSFAPTTKPNETPRIRPRTFNRTCTSYTPGLHACPSPLGWENTSHSGDLIWGLRHCKLFICPNLSTLKDKDHPRDVSDARFRGMLGQWEHCEVFLEWVPGYMRGMGKLGQEMMRECDAVCVDVEFVEEGVKEEEGGKKVQFRVAHFVELESDGLKINFGNGGRFLPFKY